MRKNILKQIVKQFNVVLDLFDNDYMDYDLLDEEYFKLLGMCNMALKLIKNRKARTQILAYAKQAKKHYTVAHDFLKAINT